MRLAAIDLGTNSVHMVIADVTGDGHIQVVDRVKETVRLGRGVFLTGRLRKSAMDLAVQSLVNFRRLLELRKVDRVRAVATSAVREARNGRAFINRIRRRTGIEAEIISGAEEARLIFLAARHALALENSPPCLLVDVGGGSVELVLARGGEALWMRSLKLGVARMTERFLGGDPPGAAQVRDMERHLAREIGDLLRDARKRKVVRAVGTSGTINTLVAMARSARGEESGRLHGASASAGEIARIRGKLLKSKLAERAELPGMDAKRADLMPAAAILAGFILRESGAKKLVACAWALREGVLLELAGLADRIAAGAARRHSVNALARKFDGTDPHGPQVARLALALFDKVAPALGLEPQCRELLEYAALLHDIGHRIDHDRHNRHSYYLITSADLLGFEPWEIEVIALASRGHRRQGARFDSPELLALPADKRRWSRGLAAILRVADALDRSHFGVVKDIILHLLPDRLAVDVDCGNEPADLELWTCQRRTELLAKLLNRPIVLRRVRRKSPQATASRREPSRSRPTAEVC
jgi:exopolyphosphatase/guanosine-5'-triphosphate,3'-diphosphate pyrophosphatase